MEKHIRKWIKKAVEKEFAYANKKHSQFNSMHEGYAVLLEEVEELEEEAGEIKTPLARLWGKIRSDDADCEEELKEIYETAISQHAKLCKLRQWHINVCIGLRLTLLARREKEI